VKKGVVASICYVTEKITNNLVAVTFASSGNVLSRKDFNPEPKETEIGVASENAVNGRMNSDSILDYIKYQFEK